MKVEVSGDTLRISDVRELVAANSSLFREEAREAMGEGQKHVEVDLSRTVSMDSAGLGALVGLFRLANSRKGDLRLLNPQPPVQQILEITRMHRVFKVVSG